VHGEIAGPLAGENGVLAGALDMLVRTWLVLRLLILRRIGALLMLGLLILILIAGLLMLSLLLLALLIWVRSRLVLAGVPKPILAKIARSKTLLSRETTLPKGQNVVADCHHPAHRDLPAILLDGHEEPGPIRGTSACGLAFVVRAALAGVACALRLRLARSRLSCAGRPRALAGRLGREKKGR
jgi:hypothetical protein